MKLGSLFGRPSSRKGTEAATPAEARISRGILVVEDDGFYANLLVRAGERLKEAVSTARNVEEAQNLAKRFHYKTMFVDHYMVGGNGETFVRFLKENDLAAATRVFVMTGENPSVVALKYVGLPVDEFLKKPISVDRLVELLRLPPKTDDAAASSSPDPRAKPGNDRPEGGRT